MTAGRLAYAKRRALAIFDKWNDVTGAVQKHSSWYSELESVIEDAVEVGVQEALDDVRKLESET